MSPVSSVVSSFRAELFDLDRRDDPAAFTDGDDLIGFDLSEAFKLLRGWPLDLDQIYGLSLSHAEVESQVALRHHAGAAVHFIHLRVIAGDDPHAGADGSAIAFGAEQFDLDPVLQVAAIVA